MRLDSCVRCDSKNIELVEKSFNFDFPNPGKVTVTQQCYECQECNEAYFDEAQDIELSRKVDEKRKELDSAEK